MVRPLHCDRVMTDRHELLAYDYVNHPYEVVRDALLADPRSIFHRATTSAVGRGQELRTDLRAKAGPFDLGTSIEIEVRPIDGGESPDGRPATRFAIEWKAAQRPALFPTMKATLAVYALSATETQLYLAGVYDPPLGVLGEALDAIALHRIAAESVTGFIRDVAAWLRAALSSGYAELPQPSTTRTT